MTQTGKTNFAPDAFKRVGGCQGSGFLIRPAILSIKRLLMALWRVFFSGLVASKPRFGRLPGFIPSKTASFARIYISAGA